VLFIIKYVKGEDPTP